MRQEIEKFFRGYCDAYNRFDPRGVAQCFAVPSLLAERNCIVWTTEAQVQDNMERLLAYYRANHFEEADFAVEQMMVQGHGDAVVNLLWIIKRDGGNPPWRFHTGYNLRRFGDGWRIIMCTVYEELQARDTAK